MPSNDQMFANINELLEIVADGIPEDIIPIADKALAGDKDAVLEIIFAYTQLKIAADFLGFKQYAKTSKGGMARKGMSDKIHNAIRSEAERLRKANPKLTKKGIAERLSKTYKLSSERIRKLI